MIVLRDVVLSNSTIFGKDFLYFIDFFHCFFCDPTEDFSSTLLLMTHNNNILYDILCSHVECCCSKHNDIRAQM